jgi:hypothetical protein
MLERASFEEGGRCRFTIGAVHRLGVPQHRVGAGFAHAANLLWGLYPDDFALVTGHRVGWPCSGSLAGCHKADEPEAGGKKECFGKRFHRTIFFYFDVAIPWLVEEAM